MLDLQPAAGHYLLAGIDTVLTRLNSGPQPVPDFHPLADDLRVALARTAACGDTCRVRPAADAVRLAVGLLLSGAVDQALPMLQTARAELASRRSHHN